MKYLALMVAFWGRAALAEDLVIDQSGFTAVHVNEGIKVMIEPGPEYSVTGRALGEADISKLEVNRYGGWLAFNRATRWLIFANWRDDKFEISMTTPVLNEVKSFEGSSVFVFGLENEALRAESASEGSLTLLDLRVSDLTIVANEGGHIAVSGTCDTLTVAGTSGFIDAATLDCSAAVVSAEDDVLLILPEAIPLVDAHESND